MFKRKKIWEKIFCHLIKGRSLDVKNVTPSKEMDSVFSFKATVTNIGRCVLEFVTFLVMFKLA